ncbi:MAG: MacB family efflux pump subunit [Bauldia sp.]
MNVLANPAVDARRLAVSLRGIGKTYVNGDLATEVLRDVALDIGAGEMVAIIGQSGSGKSTLMNIIGCLDQPTVGDYRLNGVEVASLSSDELAHLRRDTFGFVFQSYNLIPTLTAAENVELPATYGGLPRDERRERAEQLLTQLGLGERMEHRPSQLSGGQQQRVSIARALMNGGGIILADEPTGALDRRSGEEVLGILEGMRDAGHTVIIITHDRNVAEHADRIVEISDGRIVGESAGRRRAPPAERVASTAGRGRIGGIGEAVKMGWRALIAKPMRTVLTLLGIVIGVAAVIVMMAIGAGSSQDILDRISGLGSNQLTISAGVAGGTRLQNSGAALSTEDAEALAALPNVQAVVPVNSGNLTLRAGGANVQTSATATWPNYAEALGWDVALGTFITDADEADYATVAVLGQTVAETLFPGNLNPVGEWFIAGRFPFQVVGVMSERGTSGIGGGDPDNVIIVPLSTGSLRFLGTRSVRQITVVVEDETLIDRTEALVSAVLAERHGVVDFTIRNNASLLETVTETQSTFTLLLGSVAAISLLVGGIGIMNIMLVNVTERTREIGIRMATGARMRDIVRQFNTEAVVVSAVGGFIGAAIGLAVAFLLSRFGVAIVFSAQPVLLAFGCAFLTGLLFGYLPARKAARLDPAAALAAV